MGQPTRLADEQTRALDRLRQVDGIDRFYLAGGSAVAYHLGHRVSRDLNLFSDDEHVDLDRFREALRQSVVDLKVLAQTDASLRVRIEGTPVDFVRYPYPPLHQPEVGPAGIRTARPDDLAAMKLATIASRGLRRDFWDLYALLQHGLTLTEAARCYLDRFGLSHPDLYHLARALTYFVDAEREPYPSGLSEQEWQTIKAFFRREAPKLLGAP
jgi:hypothetical protein